MAPLALGALRRRHLEKGVPLPLAVEVQLRADLRPGAQALMAAIEERRRRNRAEGQRLRQRLRHERALWETGVLWVAGVDEAGMSPLAGPVAAAAVILPREARWVGVDDSKLLTAPLRRRLAAVIKEQAVAWSVAFVEPAEIDQLNIYHAGLAAMARAVAELKVAPEHLLIDGRLLKQTALPQTRIFGGDGKSLSIGAASILAKTARDARMEALEALYPGYGFAQHKGYPVKAHFEALRRLGPCPIHRRSFAPVRDWSS